MIFKKASYDPFKYIIYIIAWLQVKNSEIVIIKEIKLKG